MQLKKCRNCNSKKISNLFTLGNQSYTGKFPEYPNQIVKKGEINLVICNKCNLVQLGNRFDLKYLYGPSYGYRTGINQTMTNHVQQITRYLKNKVKLSKGESVLDIASNDGTLLNFYDKNIIKFGIDPLVKKYLSNYKKINYKISNFFNYNKVAKKYKKKFKIITALSVFYDLENPNLFLQGIEKLLDSKGIALIEIADLYSILKKKMFDAICHEHLEYYSTEVLINMFKKNRLKLIDIKENDINGSSKQFYLAKINSSLRVNLKKINNVIKKEKNLKMNKIKTFYNFKNEIDKIKLKLINKLNQIKNNNGRIHGYGASTKGNVLLQYFGIDNKYLDFIAERNPKKYGCYTPGTKIKIISEKKSRALKPDFYLVLPWHFKEEIIKRESSTLKSGTKLIFPLPNLKIISK